MKLFLALFQMLRVVNNKKLVIKSTEKKKGKAIPLQAWTGPEVSRRLRFPEFKTVGT